MDKSSFIVLEFVKDERHTPGRTILLTQAARDEINVHKIKTPIRYCEINQTSKTHRRQNFVFWLFLINTRRTNEAHSGGGERGERDTKSHLTVTP